MNNEIKSNLEGLYDYYKTVLDNTSLYNILDDLMTKNPLYTDFNIGFLTSLFENQEIKHLKKAKTNTELINTFQKAITIEIDDTETISQLKDDILNSIPLIKDSISNKKKQYKNRAIFLEYQFEPLASFYGFGKGNFPIVDTFTSFDFNDMKSLYKNIGLINYTKIWKALTVFDEILERANIYDQVIESETYKTLHKCYQLKTYLLLHEAFKSINIKVFNGIKIKKPLFIYGGEHGCEAINIYVFE
ncbi:hypothetical protein [uncultured Algibacter sp.]|uniref:hypothetical protein n=1 Tax=uncultured Algibacter sp. TaxID=298659 RepID=UPI00321765A1